MNTHPKGRVRDGAPPKRPKAMKTSLIRPALALALTCACVSASHAEPLTPVVRSASPHGAPAAFKSSSAVHRAAAAQTHKATVSVLTDNSRGQEVSNVLAVSADPGMPRLYEGERSGSVYDINAEPGVYDIVAYVVSDDSDTQIFLFKENVDLSAGDQNVLLNQRDAKTSTAMGRVSPSGSALTLPSAGDLGDCSVADHLLMLRHKDFGTLLIDEFAAFRKVCSRIAVNLVPERMSFTRMDAFAWEGGPAFIVTPVDFSKEANGPHDGSGWVSVEADFAATPLSEAWNATQESPLFAMTGYFIVSGGVCNTYVGMGNYNHEFPTRRIHYWVPEDYDGYYEFCPVMRDGLVAMADASVSSMPYRMGPDGLAPCGLNLMGGNSLMTKDGRLPDKGHPRFTGQLPEKACLGEGVPALVCVPTLSDSPTWKNGFFYGFKGRHGEELGIDSYNFTDFLTDEELGSAGGYRRSLSVSCDGKAICTSPADFYKWMDWGSGEEYRFEITMSNVLIGGETPGANTATLTYLASDGFIPTVTSLQTRDADDKVSMRLGSGKGASLEFTAATFNALPQSSRDKCGFKAPSAVKAEYAPHGTDSFRELAVEEMPGLFFLPGYGNYYKAPLDGAEKEGWYDLRITVSGAPGASQTQTLSPAFKITGYHAADTVAADTAQGGCTVYSIDGTPVAHGDASGLRPGIYLMAKGSKVSKIRVR